MVASAYANKYLKDMNAKIDVIKEPRGFIKTLQIFLAIMAFATTTGFSTKYSFTASSGSCGDSIVSVSIHYPFNSDQVKQVKQVCSEDQEFTVSADVSSDCRFFVAIGVLAMLYSIMALVVYLFYSELYESKKLYPCSDFVVHALLTVLWFTCACSWSAGVSVLKSATDVSLFSEDQCPVTCTTSDSDTVASFAKVNFSLIMGFLNAFVWGANLWFLYKETPWFSSGDQQSSPTVSPSSTTVSA